MDIYFRTKRLQKLCSISREAQRHLGAKRARRLQQRMMELKAAISLDDISRLPPARCHELTGNRKGQLSVDSTVGSGTTFTIKLPIQKKDKADESAPLIEEEIRCG